MRNGINNTLTETSKFLSLILRHKPQVIGITLDEHDWSDVSELVCKLGITIEMLEEIVATDNKGRYSFNVDKTLIRANQGHSIPVDVELEKVVPPDVLYHGTGRKYVASSEFSTETQSPSDVERIGVVQSGNSMKDRKGQKGGKSWIEHIF